MKILLVFLSLFLMFPSKQFVEERIETKANHSKEEVNRKNTKTATPVNEIFRQEGEQYNYFYTSYQNPGSHGFVSILKDGYLLWRPPAATEAYVSEFMDADTGERINVKRLVEVPDSTLNGQSMIMLLCADGQGKIYWLYENPDATPYVLKMKEIVENPDGSENFGLNEGEYFTDVAVVVERGNSLQNTLYHINTMTNQARERIDILNWNHHFLATIWDSSVAGRTHSYSDSANISLSFHPSKLVGDAIGYSATTNLVSMFSFPMHGWTKNYDQAELESSFKKRRDVGDLSISLSNDGVLTIDQYNWLFEHPVPVVVANNIKDVGMVGSTIIAIRNDNTLWAKQRAHHSEYFYQAQDVTSSITDQGYSQLNSIGFSANGNLVVDNGTTITLKEHLSSADLGVKFQGIPNVKVIETQLGLDIDFSMVGIDSTPYTAKVEMLKDGSKIFEHEFQIANGENKRIQTSIMGEKDKTYKINVLIKERGTSSWRFNDYFTHKVVTQYPPPPTPGTPGQPPTPIVPPIPPTNQQTPPTPDSPVAPVPPQPGYFPPGVSPPTLPPIQKPPTPTPDPEVPTTPTKPVLPVEKPPSPIQKPPPPVPKPPGSPVHQIPNIIWSSEKPPPPISNIIPPGQKPPSPTPSISSPKSKMPGNISNIIPPGQKPPTPILRTDPMFNTQSWSENFRIWTLAIGGAIVFIVMIIILWFIKRNVFRKRKQVNL